MNSKKKDKKNKKKFRFFGKKKKGNVAAISLQQQYELTKEQKLFLIFAGSAALFAIAIGMLFVITGMRLKAQMNERNVMVSQNSDATKVERPCMINLEAAFDVEPVDLELMSPSGILYDASTATSYTSEAGRVTMSLIATETGNWQVLSNQKANTAVGVTFSTQYVENIFAQNVSISDTTDGKTAVSFMPMYKSGAEHKEFTYEITLFSDVTDQTATFGPVTAQSEYMETAELDTASLSYASDWELSIMTQTDNAEMTTVYTENDLTCGRQ